MAKLYRVRVFGKAGCDKCKVLNDRLDALLQKSEWGDFEKEYCDLDTVDGLLAFCRSECINPQRIPALVVTRREGESEHYKPILDPDPDRHERAQAKARLYHVLGLQTDYSESGRGVITPKMIENVLAEARSS